MQKITTLNNTGSNKEKNQTWELVPKQTQNTFLFIFHPFSTTKHQQAMTIKQTGIQ